MPKKITLTTVKSFVRKNREQLQIMKLSQFDGMIDAVSNCENPAFHPASAPDTTNKAFKSLGRDPYMGMAGAWFVYGSRDHFRDYNENGMVGIEVSNCCGRFVLAIPEAPPAAEPSPLLDQLVAKIEAPVFKVAIVDAEKAGLINGPFWVVVLKDGKVVSSTTGIQGPTGAAGVARNYCSAYRAVMA